MNFICTPTSKEAMHRLDYDKCIDGDLVELPLNQIELNKLWLSGLFRELNDELDIYIDDYEEEEILEKNKLLKAKEIVTDYIGQHPENESLPKLLNLVILAIEKNTGLFIFT